MSPLRLSTLTKCAALIGALSLLSLLASACRPRPNMCAEARDCGHASCVAGRCQSDAGLPQIESASRFVYEPVDVACVRSEDPSPQSLPPYCSLGRADSARLLLRFSVPLSDQAEVVEAYVVLHRSPLVRVDPNPLTIHASRIESEWHGGSVVYETLPLIEGTRTADTRIGSNDVVRVDVKEIVKKWRRRDAVDQGIAIESTTNASTSDALGTAFALAPDAEGSARMPELEVYVK